MQKPFKVLHILDHSLPLHSGYTFRTRAIIREQTALGIVTSQITSSKHNEATDCQSAAETVDALLFYRTEPGKFSQLPFINQGDVVFTLYKRLCEVIEQESPDVLHAHSPCLNGLAALWAGRKFKLPVVYELRASWEDAAVSHGTCTEGSLRYRLSRALETFVLKRCDRITTICYGLKKDIESRHIESGKTTVIANAVDIGKFQPLTEKDPDIVAKHELHNQFVVGFIGSFYEYEGLDLLISAFSLIQSECPDMRVVLVGGGQAEQALKARVNSLGLAAKVLFTGRVDHKEVNKYYSTVDVLAYPRLPMRLTDLVTPLKPLEAMAMGKVSVASDVGGHKELIEDGKDGILFKAGDAEALAAVLRKLYQNPDLSELIANGLQKVTEEKNWMNSVLNYRSVYSDLSAKDIEWKSQVE